MYFGGNGEIAKKRDGYACLKCNMPESEHLKVYGCSLSIDHIDGKGRYSKVKNHALDNLQTLCLSCHGTKDNRRPITSWDIKTRVCRACEIELPIEKFAFKRNKNHPQRQTVCNGCFYKVYHKK